MEKCTGKLVYRAFIMADSTVNNCTEMLQQSIGYPCVEKLIGFIFMYDVLGKMLGELCILTGALLHCKIHVFPME